MVGNELEGGMKSKLQMLTIIQWIGRQSVIQWTGCTLFEKSCSEKNWEWGGEEPKETNSPLLPSKGVRNGG